MNRIALLCFGLLGLLSHALLRAAGRPNIVVILADDMGYSDIGAYGGEIETPHLDKMASGGLCFTQFYNNARCCPTRASLMTGLHPHQAGIGHMTRPQAPFDGEGPPAYAGVLNDSAVTLAEVAKAAGYATYMAGKWHLSGMKRRDQWPLQRGFDRFFGIIEGATHYFHPAGPQSIYSGNARIKNSASTTERPFYTTDAFADHARRFLDAHMEQDPERPFFLYLAFNAPHWPHHAPDEELAKYAGRYQDGWDTLREQRFARQQASGLIPKAWKLSPRDPEVPQWDEVQADIRQQSAARMAAYAAVIDRMDQKIGDVMETLKTHGVYENTVVVFLSDNGACAEISIVGVGDPVADRAAGTDLVRPSYGKGWANASATPYRLYKHFAHEGGSNTPCIVQWPAKIQPGRGWYREPAQIHDLMPTLVELTRGEYPETFAGHAILQTEGISLVPAFEGRPLARTRPLFLEHEGNAFVRDGEWKLVGREVAKPKWMLRQNWELYHIGADGTELRNLAGDEPQRVQAMAAQWEEFARRTGVYPKEKGGYVVPVRP